MSYASKTIDDTRSLSLLFTSRSYTVHYIYAPQMHFSRNQVNYNFKHFIETIVEESLLLTGDFISISFARTTYPSRRLGVQESKFAAMQTG